MNRYFFYIQYLPKKVNCEFLTGKCIRILHAFQTRFDLRNIGVTFPDWSHSSIGRVIGFVSESESSLLLLSSQHYFFRMKEEGYFDLSEVQPLPGNRERQEFIYYRERRLEKETSAAQKRRLKRLQSRSEVLGINYEPKRSVPKQTEVPFTHKLAFSSSSGSDFAFFIGRLTCKERHSANFSSYGLGDRPKIKGSVPCLRPFILGLT